MKIISFNLINRINKCYYSFLFLKEILFKNYLFIDDDIRCFIFYIENIR